MSEILITLITFLFIISGVMIFLYNKKDFTKFHLMLYFTLLASWTAMFMFKTNPNLHNKGFLSNWWAWPIVISLFQFMQVVVRLPLGKLSQKLKSRKIPIMVSMFVLLIGLVIVVSSNFSDWAIVIAIMCTGVLGATFGLDAQYWSENWNIKNGFYSMVIVFTIPFSAQMFSGFMNSSFGEANINLFWVAFAAIVLLTITFVLYSIFTAEYKDTIFIDNMNPRAKPFKEKTMYDIFVLSIATALMVGAFTFVTNIGLKFTSITNIEKLVFPIVQILFVIIIPVILSKIKSIWILNIMSQVTLFISLLIISLLVATNNTNVPVIIILIAISNAAFGTYIALMFGTALHFDQKHPALVLGIFLTIKSFLTGGALLSSGLLIGQNTQGALSMWTIGWISFGITISLTITSVYISMHKFIIYRKCNNIKSLLEDSHKFEFAE